MKSAFLSVVAIVLVSGLQTPVNISTQKTDRPDRAARQLNDVVGGRLWMETAGGVRGPPVVLDFGLGGPPTTWDAIFPEIAKLARVVKYHRAGYGKSDAPYSQ